MKLSIRTLDQKTITFELNDASEKVLQLKQRLVALPEISQPVENLQLIYGGRIMQDDHKLIDYNIMEDKIIVLMTKKVQEKEQNKQQQQQQPAPPTPTPAEVPRPSLTPDEQRVRDLILMGYEEQDVRAALRASFNHPERAIEYLITGIPNQADQQQTTAGSHDGAEVSEAAERLNYLATDPRFAHVRDLVRQNPELLELVLSHLRETDPAAFATIRNNQEEFVNMLNQPTAADLSSDDEAAVERLMALGFERDVVVPVYLACDKNEELTADLLFRDTDEEDN
ncbi:GH18491 [Drosophila grimshawi]|uniref:UV excision repair protein RAD23 n=2 Tax=Drosophila grimshawi TaxID=7222 RepID=B4JIH1_DROGR|nr:GH18491 [Drosophila grimshawi]